MKLTLESLKKAGAFTGRPVEKEINWKQGIKEFKATVFIRPLGYHTATSDVLAHVGKVDGVAGRIAASVCDEEGHPVFTPQDITGEADPDRGALDGSLTIALLVAIQEVNDLGKTINSAPKTNSGANLSSTGSGAVRSRRRKKGSTSESTSSGESTAGVMEA